MKKIRFPLILAGLLSTQTSGTAQNNFVLQNSSRSAIQFAINNKPPALDTLTIRGRKNVRPVFENQVGTLAVAGVDIPKQAAILALPPYEAQYDLDLITTQWAPVESSLPLAPPMALQRDSALGAVVFETEIADETEWPNIAQIEHTGWYRNLKIARVEIFPLRIENGRLEYLQSATFRLRWNVTQATPRITAVNPISAQILAAQENLALYENAVLNPADVKSYLQRDLTLAKRASVKAGEQYLIFDIDENGVYRIDGATLRSQGIDIAGIDPAALRMYNNGGRILPSNLAVARPDTLIEIPIIVQDGGDGRFDDNDAIFFFGVSVNDWAFNALEQSWQHFTNPFETLNTYWLSWFAKSTPAKRQSTIALGGAATTPRTTGLKLAKVENEINNPISSGRDWYGREISSGETASFTFRFSAPPQNATGSIYYRVVSKTVGRHSPRLLWNGQALDNISFTGSAHPEGYLILRERTRKVLLSTGSIKPENTVAVEYTSSESFGKLYVDWIEVVAEDGLIANAENQTIAFATQPETGIARFQLAGLAENVRIFEISDPIRPRYFAFERNGSDIFFTDSMSVTTPRRYFASTATRTPQNYRLYTTSDLRSPQKGADLIIISYKDFLEEANRLADHKRSFRGFEVEIVDIETVLNEFAWGLLDPVAIRDFIAYAFHNWRKQPRYVLLFGDATYDYRDIAKGTHRDLLPSYQSEASRLEELFNRNVEAFFVYVNGADRDMDLAIGRLTPQTVSDARNMVDKIIEYESNPENGIWRTSLTMVADDEFVAGGRDNNETIHVIDAERISENFVPDYMNVQKIYLMQYRGVREASISGIRKPGAQRDLLDQINTGTLIANYIGHGNSTQWAHEVVFEQGRDFPQLKNGKKQTFIVAATCDFGRFDKLNSQSFPEEMLAARDRGIIGIITSSRVVFASSNARFNEQYYRQLFGTNLNGQTIGEAMMNARLFTFDITNDEKYAILGDPSMKLGVPTVPANVTNVTPDSLFALSQTRVQGIVGGDTTLVQDGRIELLVFDDARRTRYTTGNGLSVNYLLPGNLLFRGIGTLNNNRFDMSFIVPKDVTYGGQSARISVYGFDENMEAIGVDEPIPVSLRSGVLFDGTGPAITVNFDGRESFATGDPVPQQATMTATIVDSISGINVTAEIGHKITFTIDGETQNQLDLTRNFVYFPNDFRGGQLVTQLPELPLGRHFAELKAWDNSNNSATAFIEFVVTERDVISLTEVWNYPNPFSDNTSFTFTLNTEAEVKISIYTIAGRLIKTIENVMARPGFNQIPWDGLDEDGDILANGVYLYKIVAKSTIDDVSKSADFIGKIAVRR
jgi:hypothetical protein